MVDCGRQPPSSPLSRMVSGAVPKWDYSGPMTELHVRNLSPDLHDLLRARAARQGRSMSGEALVILREALLQVDQPPRRASAITRLAALRERNPLPAGAPLAQDLVREDREAVSTSAQ